jgi:apolipoprotein N-acyltransferase
MVPKAVLTWVLMIPVAILNGIFRESVIRPRVGELRAHQLSVVTGSTGFVALVYALWRGEAGRIEDRDLFRMGAAWVVATIIFEFGFGHYLRGFSWEELLHDYNIGAGRLWVVVLLVILFSPLIAKRLTTR